MNGQPLAELIDRSIAASGPQVEQLIFGGSQPDAIAGLFDAWSSEHLGAPVREAHWYRVSIGAVAACRLGDGRDVVIKVLPSRYPLPFLTAARRVQAHLARRGYPAPAILGTPAPMGRGNAGAEALVDDPGAHVPDPSQRPNSAAALARLVVLAREIPLAEVEALSPHPLDAPAAGAHLADAHLPDLLYPEPHSPLFDFTIDNDTTRHVDALAREAVRVRALDEAPRVITHTDFAARNVRFDARDAHGVCAVFDWDSLAIVAESVAVGQAAVTWNALAEPGEALAPSPEEVAGYVTDYERARGVGFTPVQRAAAGAAALWVLAYSSRCELSLGEAAGHRRCLDRLLADGARYLDLPAEA